MALKIVKRQAQNQYYDDPLAEGVLPLRMILIPGDTFLMGSPEEELEHFDVEGPQHEVTVPQFFMAKYPVTQAQWRVVAAMPQVKHELKPDLSHFKGDLRPVEKVSWYEAVEFCDRITIHTNRLYRLPTEAEWEYACRAGTTTPFHFGETLSTDYANYDGANENYGVYGPGATGEYRKETTPADHFNVANAYGLCEMHGNVFEWCQDHWHDNYEGAPSDGSARLTEDEEAFRVLRGGAWNNLPKICRSAYRCYSSPDNRNYGIGFRVVCSAPRVLQ
jgi:formylglycine-generating enzyme required for sulfatase activity